MQALLQHVCETFKQEGGMVIDPNSKEYSIKDKDQNIILQKLEDIGKHFHCLIIHRFLEHQESSSGPHRIRRKGPSERTGQAFGL